jgi:3-deoxy-D-manno-octulosonic acid (KDO) 8-phosphate synthase
MYESAGLKEHFLSVFLQMCESAGLGIIYKNLFNEVLGTSLNKFRELTSPEDLHIYRKAKERFTRVQRTRTLAHS